MLKNYLLIILFVISIGVVYAAPVATSYSPVPLQDGTAAGVSFKTGCKVIPAVNISITGIEVLNAGGLTKTYILDASKNVINSSSISSYNSTYASYPLVAGTSYYFAADAAGSAVAVPYKAGASYVYVGSQMNITKLLYNGAEYTNDWYAIKTIYYTYEVPVVYSVWGYVLYNGTALVNASVTLINDTSGTAVGTAKTNGSGYYFINGSLTPAMSNQSVWLIVFSWRNATNWYTKSNFTQLTVGTQ